MLILGTIDPVDLEEDPLAYWPCPGCGCLVTGLGFGPWALACSPECGDRHQADLDREAALPLPPPCPHSGLSICPPECPCLQGVPW